MTIVKLQGGLGNQMFQYAAARGISNEFIYFDHSTLEQNNSDTEHFTARNYELGIFKNIKAHKASSYQVKLFTDSSIFFKIPRFFLKPLFIKQKENEYILFPERFRFKFRYFDGYFQSEKYFKHIQKQLLSEFEFPPFDIKNESLKTQIINTPNSVSIHIRRGDYLKSPFIFDVHGVLPLSYYYNAWQILQSTYSKLSIFIFSDDINWAKANLKFQKDNIHFISGNDSNNAWKDMALMCSCKHHIIANSSFSWWGAWLSNNSGKVIAPDRWFNPANVNFNIHDFIPNNWTILNVE